MTALVSLAYLFSGVCFIMALRGLASPETARQGNLFGMFGMAVAIVTTLCLIEIFVFLVHRDCGCAGRQHRRRCRAQHQNDRACRNWWRRFIHWSGLPPCWSPRRRFLNPGAYGILEGGNIHVSSLIEMGLGAAIGAITFSGSLVAFAKLQGLVSGKPLTFQIPALSQSRPRHFDRAVS